MDILNKVKGWAKSFADVGFSLIALGIVLEVLFKGQNIPFWPDMMIIENITGIVKTLSAEGLTGLVAVYVLYAIYTKK
jgi:hypothetical protein|tara:strand:+ start:851 stop:1084 length:234 start_codon:yes stop_codon:yes gene_type:complete